LLALESTSICFRLRAQHKAEFLEKNVIYQKVTLSQQQENTEMCFQLAREGTQPQMPCHLVLLRW
jgi:hypothetical protein